jgi:transcriptional regulator
LQPGRSYNPANLRNLAAINRGATNLAARRAVRLRDTQPWKEHRAMYVPPAFQVTDQDRLFDFIEAHSFGLLVSTLEGQPFASHLPLPVDRERGPHGRLVAHMARANPQWRELAGQNVLVVFSGPHAYISPRWYETENVVPTWNYVAVHAYGPAKLVGDERALGDILELTVATYERHMPEPWSVDRRTAFFDRLSKMVVGFEIEIGRLEGKWKLGQNHPAAWRENAARSLAEDGSYDAAAIAQLMREALG